MGYLIAIGFLVAVIVIGALAIHGGNHARRFQMWFDPGMAASCSEYELHCRFIVKLIDYHQDLVGVMRMQGSHSVAKSGRSVNKALIGGINWMRQVKMSGDPTIKPHDGHYLYWYRMLEDGLRNEQTGENKTIFELMWYGGGDGESAREAHED